MKLTINNKLLLEVLNQIGKFRGKDILQNVQFSTNGKEFVFHVTDDEITYIRRLPYQIGEEVIGTVEEDGIIMLPTKFDEIVRKLDKKDISLELTGQTLLVKQGTTVAKVNVSTGDFPPMPVGERSGGLELSKELFAIMVNQTGFAASDKDTRPILKAIHMESVEEGFKIIATDSRRLSQRVSDIKNDLPTLNIPAKKLSQVIDTLEDNTTLNLIPFGNHIILETPNSDIYLRQLEGTYPDVSKLMTITGKTKVKVNSKDLLSEINRAMTFVKDDNNLSITFELLENKLKVYSSGDEGSLEGYIAADIEGEHFKFSVNSNYTVQAIKSFQQETVTFYICDPKRPIFILSESEPTLTQMILPVLMH